MLFSVFSLLASTFWANWFFTSTVVVAADVVIIGVGADVTLQTINFAGVVVLVGAAATTTGTDWVVVVAGTDTAAGAATAAAVPGLAAAPTIIGVVVPLVTTFTNLPVVAMAEIAVVAVDVVSTAVARMLDAEPVD